MFKIVDIQNPLQQFYNNWYFHIVTNLHDDELLVIKICFVNFIMGLNVFIII